MKRPTVTPAMHSEHAPHMPPIRSSLRARQRGGPQWRVPAARAAPLGGHGRIENIAAPARQVGRDDRRQSAGRQDAVRLNFLRAGEMRVGRPRPSAGARARRAHEHTRA